MMDAVLSYHQLFRGVAPGALHSLKQGGDKHQETVDSVPICTAETCTLQKRVTNQTQVPSLVVQMLLRS